MFNDLNIIEGEKVLEYLGISNEDFYKMNIDSQKLILQNYMKLKSILNKNNKVEINKVKKLNK